MMDHLAWPHQLRRKFRLLIFDWDGTAVEDREKPVPELAQAMEELLRRGVKLALITGTKLDYIFENCIRLIAKSLRQDRLFAFTNRGSEVWTFDTAGEPVLTWRFQVTEEQDRALDAAAEATRRFLSEKGLNVAVISNRLNRRKVDLLPEPRWKNPKKSEIAELLRALERKLVLAGVTEGLSGIAADVLGFARDAGLEHPKVTSDVKHVEIGLTDKSDSVQWIVKNIVIPEGISYDDVAVFGDEFGAIAGLCGSDSMMQIRELSDVVFASVGIEPNGVPDEVLHLHGGPPRLLRFLRYERELSDHGMNLFEPPWIPTVAPTWLIEQEGFDPSRAHEMESLFSFGNGYLGFRGSSIIPIPSSQVEFYAAGIYDKKAAVFPYSEIEFIASEDRPSHFSEIVAFPSPFRVLIRANGRELVPGSSSMRGRERVLDLKKGILSEILYFEDPEGEEIVLRSSLMASLRDPHVLLHEIALHATGKTPIELEHSQELSDFGLRYPHLKGPKARIEADLSVSVFRTQASRFTLALALKRQFNGKPHGSGSQFILEPGRAHVLQTLMSVFTSRDLPDPASAAQARTRELDFGSFDREVSEHTGIWNLFWERADIRMEEKSAMTQAERFGLYQLRTAAPVLPSTSIPARGLTGRSYEGHVFWDTEIFMLPFYVAIAPEFARNALLYRFLTLPGARDRARAMGYRGACFAWESTVDGQDVTPTSIILSESKKSVPILTGHEQIHVTADIAHAVWQYWRRTRDDRFMTEAGLEILIETARFWASRISRTETRFHILGVIGPDEYHHEVADNAYTNWMAKLNLEKAAEAISWAQSHKPRESRGLLDRLGVSSDELRDWRFAADALFMPQPNSDGIIEQFAGYFELDELPIADEERLRAPVDRLLNWERINESKVIKQADVLMIPFLFPGAYSKEIVERNFRYYAPRTDHGSSLSPCVHAAIAADLGLKAEADRFFEQSLTLDLRNRMNNTPLGIHLGSIGGTWQALVLHYLGYRIEERGLVRDEKRPLRLPDDCASVQVAVKREKALEREIA